MPVLGGSGQVDKSVQPHVYKAPWKGNWLLSLMKTPEKADISTDHLIHGNKIHYLEPVKYF